MAFQDSVYLNFLFTCNNNCNYLYSTIIIIFLQKQMGLIQIILEERMKYQCLHSTNSSCTEAMSFKAMSISHLSAFSKNTKTNLSIK